MDLIAFLDVQAIRQSLLKKYARIRHEMDRLHNSKLSPYEKLECLDCIKSQIQGAWRTDEIRRQKPSPQVCPLFTRPLHRCEASSLSAIVCAELLEC